MIDPEERVDLGAGGLLAHPSGRRLAHILHDRVVQRLCGVHFVLGSSAPLGPADRRRCAVELDAAISSLRMVIRQGLDDPLSEEVGSLEAVVREVAAGRAGVEVEEGADAELAPALVWLVRAFVSEALRNAVKHAAPTVVRVTVRRIGDETRIEVANDGVRGAPRRPGTGLGVELLTAEARLHGGWVEAEPDGDDRWRARMALPLASPASAPVPMRRFRRPK